MSVSDEPLRLEQSLLFWIFYDDDAAAVKAESSSGIECGSSFVK